MVTLNGLLILTAFGLYYAGSELIRPWISGAHITAGFALAILTVLHILLGRKNLGNGPPLPTPPDTCAIVEPRRLAAHTPGLRSRPDRGTDASSGSRDDAGA
jgi:hypothetical protein